MGANTLAKWPLKRLSGLLRRWEVFGSLPPLADGRGGGGGVRIFSVSVSIVS